MRFRRADGVSALAIAGAHPGAARLDRVGVCVDRLSRDASHPASGGRRAPAQRREQLAELLAQSATDPHRRKPATGCGCGRPPIRPDRRGLRAPRWLVLQAVGQRNPQAKLWLSARGGDRDPSDERATSVVDRSPEAADALRRGTAGGVGPLRLARRARRVSHDRDASSRRSRRDRRTVPGSCRSSDRLTASSGAALVQRLIGSGAV